MIHIMNRYIFAALIFTMLATSCEKKVIPIPPTDDEITDVEDDDESVDDDKDSVSVEKPIIPEDTIVNSLSLVNPTIAGMKQSRSRVIEAWTQGNNIGLYFNNNNVSFVYDGKKWNTEEQHEVTTEAEVYAYHPYNSFIDENKRVFFDLTEQQDIMWGKTIVSPDFPAAQIEMQHKLSLIRIKLLKNEYIGTGRIDNIIFNGRTECIIDLPTGAQPYSNKTGNIRLNDTFILNDANPYIFECMLLPEVDMTNTTFSFNLDGKKLTYQFGSNTRWEEGMIYTYTIKIKGEYGTEINREDVPLDVDFWAQCGKTDDIVIKEIPMGDWENRFRIGAYYTKLGYDVYQNEGKPFGTSFSHLGNNPFVGKIRFVLMQSNNIVEKFPPVDFRTDAGYYAYKVPCFVTAAPGKYQLVPLFQREGEITWMKAYGYESDFTTENDFTYEVLPPALDNLPALRDIFLDSEGTNSNSLIYGIKFNSDFKVGFTISNKERKAIRGEVKAVWEREFKNGSNTYRPGNKDKNGTNDNEWFEEIGRTTISIPAGVKFWKDVLTCKITKWKEEPKDGMNVCYAVPIIHLYWKSEGSSEWKLLRLDSDMLMDPKQLIGDQWKVQQFWDSTVNFINVTLDEWNTFN